MWDIAVQSHIGTMWDNMASLISPTDTALGLCKLVCAPLNIHFCNMHSSWALLKMRFYSLSTNLVSVALKYPCKNGERLAE